MFIVGWEFEAQLVRPHKGLAAAVSFTSVGLAFVLGLGLAVWLYPHHSNVAGHHISFMAFGMFMGAAMSVTAFPVLTRILTDNGLTHTRLGVLALASAAVDDLLAWCMLAYVSALVAAHNTAGLVQVAVLSALFIVAMFVVVRPALAFLVSR
jgi:Kef-type K+ transport system membrane component KefB